MSDSNFPWRPKTARSQRSYTMNYQSSEGSCAMNINALPEGCIANILSLTNPLDACRLSLVSSIFRSAAGSEDVWERFLPSDYRSIIARSVSDLSEISTRKELYYSLCHSPILIDNGTKSFSLDKPSSKKCSMLGARDLTIVWSDTCAYWRWPSFSESRFAEVAELGSVCWLEIRGKIKVSMLSPTTTYAAYLVYKLSQKAHGFDCPPVEVSVGVNGSECHTKNVCLNPSYRTKQFRWALVFGMGHPSMAGLETPTDRVDGWLEMELGVFFNNGGKDEELEMSIKEVKSGDWKHGLIVEGIEIRPKHM